MASVAAGYLPILLFLGFALALSAAFVVLPMLVARLTGPGRIWMQTRSPDEFLSWLLPKLPKQEGGGIRVG